MTTLRVDVKDDEAGKILSEMADRQRRTPEALFMIAFEYYIPIEAALRSGAKVRIHYADGSTQEFKDYS